MCAMAARRKSEPINVPSNTNHFSYHTKHMANITIQNIWALGTFSCLGRYQSQYYMYRSEV